ncbi:MAG: hypothetical protein HY744_31230 [Deltaproteobacteria bacterium]|nr:hypothetical protein [Deltaproteobacteria bacterium]
MAQQIEQALPQVVSAGDGDQGHMGLSCTGLEAVLVEAVWEQQSIIDGQQGELASLRRELEGRRKRLGELEAGAERLQALEARLAQGWGCDTR